MTSNDFRIGWRQLVREPGYSLVVVGALAVGLAACLLLLGFVRYSWLYNATIPGVDRVYVVKLRHNVNPDAPWFDQAPLMLRGAAARTAGVEAVTGYLATRPLRTTARVDRQLMTVDSLTVLPGFADVLGVHTLQGDLAAALDRPDALAMTDAMARRAFGRTDVVGRTIQVEGRPIRILAVVQAPPSNSTVSFETLVGVNSTLVEPIVRDEMLTGSRGWWAKLLVRVRAGSTAADVRAIQAALQGAVDDAPFTRAIAPEVKARLGARKPAEIALAPLRYAYFDQQVSQHFIFDSGKRASPVVVAALGVVALLVLSLAAINYTNLATVRTLRRQREIALRKVLGGGARRIALQFLAESLLVACAATALGLLLAWLAEPTFVRLVDRPLPSMLAPANLLAALLLCIVLGVATSAYPAWIALRVHPAVALAGRPDSESPGGARVRRLLTIAQVAAGMCLASVTLAIGWQTAYAMRSSPGFDPESLLVVDIAEDVEHDQGPPIRSLAAALEGQPGIGGVAVMSDAVGRRQSFFMQELRRPGGANIAAGFKTVSANFFDVYRLKPVAGRVFDRRIDTREHGDAVVVNAVAARQLGFPDPAAAVGQPVELPGPDGGKRLCRIVGIAPEVRYGSLHTAPDPIVYDIGDKGLVLTVRSTAGVDAAERAVRALWPTYFPDAILATYRAGDVIAANYADDARLAQLLGVATAIALVIAAFGTYVLAAHTVQRRAREIVLRKLYGAAPADIGRLMLRESAALAAVAGSLALPVAALLIRLHLASYVEHASPSPYLALLLAPALTVLVVLAAVARHAAGAMRMRPATVLRA